MVEAIFGKSGRHHDNSIGRKLELAPPQAVAKQHLIRLHGHQGRVRQHVDARIREAFLVGPLLQRVGHPGCNRRDRGRETHFATLRAQQLCYQAGHVVVIVVEHHHPGTRRTVTA